jgi:ABC-type spermidine/putrescine transport system permease subunit I
VTDTGTGSHAPGPRWPPGKLGPAGAPQAGSRSRRGRSGSSQPSRAFWIALAAPGILWLTLLFIVPFYAVLAIAEGQLNRLFESPIARYNPLHWSSANLINVWHDLFGATAFAGPIVLRTLLYVAAASILSLLIGYPAAYFVSRFAGRRKGLFLVLLIAPFWISFMMRMLAWIDLLQTNGYVNKVLVSLHVVSQPVNWLGGHSVTVILGLVYGYIPYLILVLYAGLDRIDPSLIEAGRDLGLGRARTFLRVTLPLSRQPILTGMLITVLPMVGDYFTNQLLSGAPNTSMIGNLIQGQLGTPGLQGQGAVLSLLVLIVLLVPMIYYVVATNRSAQEAA